MNLLAGFCIGSWQVYPQEGRVVAAGSSKRIQPKSMDVLVCLAAAEGAVVARDTLLQDVWDGRAMSDEPLTRCIGELRRALGDSRSDPQYIETIPKRGYRLLPPVRSIEAAVPVT
ncbi:MAG: winged helix-turn-helix domain-containing protein, partial [Pseudomonadota bacterium]